MDTFSKPVVKQMLLSLLWSYGEVRKEGKGGRKEGLFVVVVCWRRGSSTVLI